MGGVDRTSEGLAVPILGAVRSFSSLHMVDHKEDGMVADVCVEGLWIPIETKDFYHGLELYDGTVMAEWMRH